MNDAPEGTTDLPDSAGAGEDTQLVADASGDLVLKSPVTEATSETATRFADVVSGQFDADEETEELAPPKRVLTPQAETPKLHKVLAQAGLGSRLEMEQLIMEGRISVNNEPAHIGQRAAKIIDGG